MNDERILLAAEGVAVGYRSRPVLQDVSLTVRGGERWYLIGPNGAGKTTLLRALMGVLPVAAGRIHRHPDLRRPGGLGFVPQRGELNPALPTTVREFTGLGLCGLRVRRDERRARIAEALDRVGLAGTERRDFWALSGGQRQRVLVARALVRRPVLLVLDEPTANLDLDAEDALLRTLDDLNRSEGVALLLVTHRVRLALEHATGVALFQGGRVTAGPREDVLTTGALAAAFGLPEAAAARFVPRREERP